MHYDIATLFSLLLIQALALALMLPLLLGWRDSRGARLAQLSAAAQALGWGLLMLLPEGSRWGATLALGSLSLSLSLLWTAVACWLPQRWGRLLSWAAPAALVLGYGAGFGNYAFRLAWSNGWLGLQLLTLTLALLQPAPRVPAHSWRWRSLLGLSCLLLGLLTLARGYLAGFATDTLPSFTSAHPLNTAFAVMTHVSLLAMTVAVLAAWRGETEDHLKRLAQSDAQTGLCNRRAFTQRAVDMISMARRYDEPLMLLMMDIDGLKAINDQHGEAVGDRAIALFAACLDDQKRLGDLVARVGGEEFAVLMARSDQQGPTALDQRVRKALAERAPAELGFALDFSSGWARLRGGDRNIDDLMRRAEAALYTAKSLGRGRLYAEPGLESEGPGTPTASA
ncbi:GGDEF domain-containing protein [Pelomonas sp. CA6]|uniref:GGDEF domain-containing protein n=1 Tax=Pelomonas sp. CA6 TaxID=2907999 RepID=UPI001F4C2A73|nr:GGDEF domain-containing protein [Pelomonas sp. CA6]MCH7344712.1 GGDEF domain-containing protein [Pelomonas sp. CA6]